LPTNGPGDGSAANAFAVIDSDLFAGTDIGVFITTAAGISWSAPKPGLNTQVTSLLAHGSDLFAITYGGIYLSKDKGSNWTIVDSAFFVNSPNDCAFTLRRQSLGFFNR
jgi:hypothetical protein